MIDVVTLLGRAVRRPPMRPIARFCLGLLAIAQADALSALQERRYLPVEWHQMWELPPRFDSPVQAPALLVGDSRGGVVTFDYGDRSLKRLVQSGDTAELDWTFGRSGQGPGEFRRPTGLYVAGDSVWVLDPDNRRLTWVSIDGGTSGVVPLAEASRAIRLPDGRGVALSVPPGELLKVFEPSTGTLLDSLSPSGFAKGTSAFVREGLITGGRYSDAFMVAFLHSGYVVHGHGSQASLGLDMMDGVEPSPFPELVSWRNSSGYVITRIDPSAAEAARWVDHDDTHFFVAFEGISGAELLVDLYATESGDYAGSIVLPEQTAYGAIVQPGVLAGLIFDPIPHIRVWRYEIDAATPEN